MVDVVMLLIWFMVELVPRLRSWKKGDAGQAAGGWSVQVDHRLARDNDGREGVSRSAAIASAVGVIDGHARGGIDAPQVRHVEPSTRHDISARRHCVGGAIGIADRQPAAVDAGTDGVAGGWRVMVILGGGRLYRC